MAIITIKFELSASQIANFQYSIIKPYQDLLDDIQDKLPGNLVFVSEVVKPLTYGLYTIYEVDFENSWFVQDFDLEPIFKEIHLDDGNGVKYKIELLSDIKMTKKGSLGTGSYSGVANHGWATGVANNNNFRNKTCVHVRVDTGFNIPNFQCKLCGKDMNK